MWPFKRKPSRIKQVKKAVAQLGMYVSSYKAWEPKYACKNCFSGGHYELLRKSFLKRPLGELVEITEDCHITYCLDCDAITDFNYDEQNDNYMKPVRFNEWLATQDPKLLDEELLMASYNQLSKEREKVIEQLNKAKQFNAKLGPYRENFLLTEKKEEG